MVHGWSEAKASLTRGYCKSGTASRCQHGYCTIFGVIRDPFSERGFAQPHVVEAIVNHVSGAKAGVAGVYNRASYPAEKRQALELWGAHVAALWKGAQVRLCRSSERSKAAAVSLPEAAAL